MRALSYIYCVEFTWRQRPGRLMLRYVEAPNAREAKIVARQRLTDDLQVSPRSIQFLSCTRKEDI